MTGRGFVTPERSARAARAGASIEGGQVLLLPPRLLSSARLAKLALRELR